MLLRKGTTANYNTGDYYVNNYSKGVEPTIMCNRCTLAVPDSFSNLDESITNLASSFVVCAAYGARCTDLMMSSQLEFLLRIIQLMKANRTKYIENSEPITINISSIFPNFVEGDLERSGILLLRKSKAIRRIKSDKEVLVLKLHPTITEHIGKT